MPTRLCSELRCPNLASYRGRCADHSRQRERQTHSNKATYNTKRWKLLRRAKLFDTPLCEHAGCGEIATDVHHAVDIARGGDPWAMGNLEALCHSHHSQITRGRQ